MVIADHEREDTFGPVAEIETLPRNLRRRLSAFDRMVVRCMSGLAQTDHPTEPIIFGSSYGNMELTYGLLEMLCDRELLSPASFSNSVHNAAVGSASQVTGNRAGHTAVAAGDASMQAALIDALARLMDGEPTVLLAFCEAPLPGDYKPFDKQHDHPAVCMVLRLGLAGNTHDIRELPIDPCGGRKGAIDFAAHLEHLPGILSWTR